eukprot:Gb_01319 [translate_table: standard]
MVATSMMLSPSAGGLIVVHDGRKVKGSISARQYGWYGKGFWVNCMAEPEPEPTNDPASKMPPLSTAPPYPPPPKVNANFCDIFAFSGPALKIINGRLAMLGFVFALGVKLAMGNYLLSQVKNGRVSWFVLSASVFIAASMIPMFKGVTRESKS